jgi:hypothetical protein
MPPSRPCSALAVAALAALVAGCAFDAASTAHFLERAQTEARPLVTPVRSVSSFSDGLACMDQLLRERGVGSTFITSKALPDASGRASVGTKDMVITALSQMSRTSNAFRYVDFEVDVVRQDTVQNLTNLLLHSNQMEIRKPSLYVSGSISYFDSGVANDRAGVGVSGPKFEVGVNADRVASLIGLELHLGDFNTRTLIPGLDAANELVIGNRGGGGDTGGKVRKAGVQFNVGRDMTQGVGPAVRTLVELGLIELVGRWARVPYWQCLALDHQHPEFQRQLKDWYDGMNPGERVRFFQQALVRTGHYRGPIDGSETPALRDALRSYQESSNAVPTGRPGFETYARLMKDYVAVDTEGRVTRIGWAKEDAPPTLRDALVTPAPAVATKERLDAAAGRDARALAVSVRLVSGDQMINVGDALQFNITLSRTAYLHCYYRDGQNRIARVYPNPMQTARIVQGRRALLVPDHTNPNSFSIEMASVGRETMGCIAQDVDVSARLPANLRGNALEPLKGVRDVKEILATHAALAPAGASGQDLLDWRVEK